MAQRRVSATCLDGRQQPPLAGGVRVPDRIDSAVQRVQPAVADAHRDRVAVQSTRAQLVDTQHTVLSRSQPRHRNVASGG
jgi:hypothetical protein